jgi:hypothetical protein
MSDENKTPAGSSNAASDYINEQLTSTRASLGRTKMVSVILVIIVLAYMSFVTKTILSHLEPQQAAETAKVVLVTQLSEKGAALAEQLKMKIPEVMAQLPDMVLTRMPTIRENVETRITTQLENYANLTADKLEPQFEQFLEDNESDINRFLDSTQDKDALKEDLGAKMDELIADFMKKESDGTATMLEKFEQSRDLLNRIADQTQRLAHDQDLTEREKQTRRAIAVLLAKADFKVYDDNWEEISSAGTDVGDE